jgi:hypothetical protein
MAADGDPAMAGRAPRWDVDPRGIGVGDARAMLPALDALRAQATQPGWVAEEPELHLLPHLERAAGATGCLGIASAVADESGRFVVELAWTGESDPDRAVVRNATYALIAAIAETTTVIREDPDAAGREVEIVTGSTEATAFAPHGHVLKFRLVDPKAR